MWSPLLKLLEGIGRIRFPFIRFRTKLVVGKPTVPDFLGTADWRAYLDGRALSRIWGPHARSPWTPFHLITLFVALDYLKRDMLGPCEADPWPVRSFQPPPWLEPTMLLIIDLPGPKTVALGAALAVYGCDLVCTFNNWPHPKGVIRPEETLAALLRYASWLAAKRTARPTPGPVAWLCDSGRLGTRIGKPGEFDNRYYIEDSAMPGPRFLRDRGIANLIYVSERADAVTPDIGVHLHAYKKDGFDLWQVVAADDGTLTAPQPLAVPSPSFKTTGFFRSSAGGFGGPVPHPSSGG